MMRNKKILSFTRSLRGSRSHGIEAGGEFFILNGLLNDNETRKEAWTP